MEIRLPSLAESITSGTVINILVSEGDWVEKDQDLLEMETDKAVAVVPSPEAGKVVKIHIKEGDELKVGETILTLSDEESGEKHEGKKEKEAKVATARRLWVPAVNNHGGFGRWSVVEVTDPWRTKSLLREALARPALV